MESKERKKMSKCYIIEFPYGAPTYIGELHTERNPHFAKKIEEAAKFETIQNAANYLIQNKFIIPRCFEDDKLSAVKDTDDLYKIVEIEIEFKYTETMRFCLSTKATIKPMPERSKNV